MQSHIQSISRRSFLSTALAAGAALSVQAKDQAPLIAYVGTFTSPLQNMWILLAAAIVPCLLPAIYSYLYYRKS